LASPNLILKSDRITAMVPESARTEIRRSKYDTICRAQAGDENAFTEIYKEHRKRVFAICMKMVRDFSLAEDLTQDAFVQLHRNLASFRGDSAFTTWLHRLTVNVVLMYMRKRVLPVVSLEQMTESIPEERVGREFGTIDLTQAGVVDRMAINRAVDDLAPGYRQIFLLHDVQGFQHCEIASMQHCSLGTSKSQLHKARRALRGVLAKRTRRSTLGLGITFQAHPYSVATGAVPVRSRAIV
jgi:RNA polymerase sigma-70 factor (ECF subfamily)